MIATVQTIAEVNSKVPACLAIGQTASGVDQESRRPEKTGPPTKGAEPSIIPFKRRCGDPVIGSLDAGEGRARHCPREGAVVVVASDALKVRLDADDPAGELPVVANLATATEVRIPAPIV